MSESAAPAIELRLETESKGPGQVLVRCSGRMISNTTPTLQATVKPLIQENKLVVLDLTNVSFMDSSGLGAVVGLWVTAKRNKCDLKMIKLNDRIKELLKMSHLSQMLEGDQEYFGY